MYILIAGYENQTKNYRVALESLGACTACLSSKFQKGPQAFPHDNPWEVKGAEPLAPFDGLLLPGGGDIYPELFGQENQGSTQVDLLLDLLQLGIRFILQKFFLIHFFLPSMVPPL